MFRTWLAILMVMVALCGGTCAEGLFSGASYDAGLAVVNGEVYCAGANIGLGFIPIWRVGRERLEKVRSRIGGWDNMYALENELLTIEPVLNIVEMLGSVPTSTFWARRTDVNTGQTQHVETFVWNTDDGVCYVFAGQNKIYRDVCAGKKHTLECLEDGEWVTAAVWTGDQAWTYETFCVIGDRRADQPEKVALYEFHTGKVYDVTVLFIRNNLRLNMAAVLEDGVLYYLEGRSFFAWNLATGEKDTLMRLPEETDAFILTETQLMAMSHEHQRAWVIDRNGWKLIQTVEMNVYPQNAALNEGKLYIRCVYGNAAVEVIDLATGESRLYSLE